MKNDLNGQSMWEVLARHTFLELCIRSSSLERAVGLRWKEGEHDTGFYQLGSSFCHLVIWHTGFT